MAKVTVRTTGKITVDTAAAEKRLIPLIVGWVLNRTSEGKDVEGRPFAAYSRSYQGTLARGGESRKVDLRTTGGMLGSLRHLRTETIAGVVTLFFGPGTGTSAGVKAVARARGRLRVGPVRPGKMSRTGGRQPAHNLKGLWLHTGTARMPARPWLGLGKAGRAMVARALEKMSIFRSR